MAGVPLAQLDLAEGWAVLQDVNEMGEEAGIWRDDFDPLRIGPTFSEWEPLARLGHLQPLLARQPYFGRELRHFNQHPWWYRHEFQAPPDQRGRAATLRFEGADYFAQVWLNGALLGRHEGYFAPFEFEAGHLLRFDRPNLLIVKVWSPWDRETLPGLGHIRSFAIIRDLFKGTYEHADTFVQRDVNPVGLWGKVGLTFHGPCRLAGRPAVDAEPPADGRSRVRVTCNVRSSIEQEVTVRCRVQEEDTGVTVATVETQAALAPGTGTLALALSIPQPRLWHTWDRGEPTLYRAVIELVSGGAVVQQCAERFGIRRIELRRMADETTFILNGERLFLRGTTYFPDVYVSAMFRERYARDLAAIRRAGCNAVRVHVHVEQPDFYDLCDELGLAVIQDSDFNWVHPADEAWTARAVTIFGDMIRHLYNHPAIIAWVCMNEPRGYSKGEFLNVRPGPQLLAEAKRLDPARPAIRGSGAWDDLESGDSHNYTGSLQEKEPFYTAIYGTTEKLNTEFGFDAPPCEANLRLVPPAHERLRPILKDIPALQHYQYRLLKYYIEHYRITKYRPCSGYVQFMFIDLCPQSFYGVYDWWGTPKEGLRALAESNQPIGIFMEHKDAPIAIWVANDLPRAFPGSVARWHVLDDSDAVVVQGEAQLDVASDSLARVADLTWPVATDRAYRVHLALRAADGMLLAQNTYHDPFHHPARPQGYPQRMSHELGMRLYSA